MYQVPDSEKAEVPEEVQRAAREMAERAFKDRLKEIKMTTFDQEQYEEFSEPIRLVSMMSYGVGGILVSSGFSNLPLIYLPSLTENK